jgi:hypothetical protein
MSTGDPHDSTTFRIECPVYVLADDAREVLFFIGPAGAFLPLFTDRDNAERFMEGQQMTDHVVSELPTRELLRLIIGAAGQAGVEYVTLDPDAIRKRRAITIPLIEFYDRLFE